MIATSHAVLHCADGQQYGAPVTTIKEVLPSPPTATKALSPGIHSAETAAFIHITQCCLSCIFRAKCIIATERLFKKTIVLLVVLYGCETWSFTLKE